MTDATTGFDILMFFRLKIQGALMYRCIFAYVLTVSLLTAHSAAAACTSNPGAPRNLQVEVSGPLRHTLTWDAPLDDGDESGTDCTITGYRVLYRSVAIVVLSCFLLVLLRV